MRRQVLPLLENFILQQLDQFCNNGNLHSVDTNIKLSQIEIYIYYENKLLGRNTFNENSKPYTIMLAIEYFYVFDHLQEL